MDVDMVFKQKKALIWAQSIGFVFGLVFAISNGFESFGAFIRDIVGGPILFAALLRFCVRTYQFVKIKFGVKVQGSSGEYVIIEKPVRGVIAAVAAPFLLLIPASLLGNAPQWLINTYLIALILVGVFFCISDIRYMIQHKQTQNHFDS